MNVISISNIIHAAKNDIISPRERRELEDLYLSRRDITLAVESDGTVLLSEDTYPQYTRHHSLTESAKRAARKVVGL